MKNLKMIILLCITNFVFAQVSPGPQIVTDPGNKAELIKTVDNTLKTLKISKESLELAKESLDKAKKINSVIRQSQITLQITENIKETYSSLQKIPGYMEGISNLRIRKNLVGHMNNIIIDITVFQDVLSNVLTDNILTMQDSERLEVLISLYDKSKVILEKSQDLNKLILRCR